MANVTYNLDSILNYPRYHSTESLKAAEKPTIYPQVYLIPCRDPATRLQPLSNKIIQIRDLLSAITQKYDNAVKPHQEALAKGFRQYYVIAAILWVAEAVLAVKAYPYVASLGAWVAHQFATGSQAMGPLIGLSPIIIMFLFAIVAGIIMGTAAPILCKADKKSEHKNAIINLGNQKKYYTDLLETFNDAQKTISYIDSNITEIHRTKYQTAVQGLHQSLYNASFDDMGLHSHYFQIFQQQAIAPQDSVALDRLIEQLKSLSFPN